MALKLVDQWVWDFWLALDGTDWHIFFLKAPKSLGDAELRHRSATIGHAVSTDLSNWNLLPDPFGTGEPGAWDDLALWTGSCIKNGDTWWMFYTGVSTTEDGKVQRIGAATSHDLITWNKVAQSPLSTADPARYETYDPDAWYEEAWRDPWVFKDADDNGFHMFITARAPTGDAQRRGVVAHATSPDLVTWETQAPVSPPGAFGHLEVPQQLTFEGNSYLVFCVQGEMQPDAPHGGALTGTAYLTSDHPLGPYELNTCRFVSADTSGSKYAGRIVVRDGRPEMLSTLHHAPDGTYVGEISDPEPVTL